MHYYLFIILATLITQRITTIISDDNRTIEEKRRSIYRKTNVVEMQCRILNINIGNNLRKLTEFVIINRIMLSLIKLILVFIPYINVLIFISDISNLAIKLFKGEE